MKTLFKQIAKLRHTAADSNITFAMVGDLARVDIYAQGSGIRISYAGSTAEVSRKVKAFRKALNLFSLPQLLNQLDQLNKGKSHE